MKKILIAAMVMCLALPMWGQTKTVNLKKDAKKIQKKEVSKKDVTPDGEKVKLYDENIDAMEQIDRALCHLPSGRQLVPLVPALRQFHHRQ